MRTVKILSIAERDAFRGFTTAPLRKLLCDVENVGQSLAVGALAWPSPIGLALVEFGREEHPVLRSIAVAKSYRRQGVGRALLCEVEDELRRRGESAVVVQVFLLGKEPAVELSGLMASVGWSDMEPVGVFCKTTYTLLLNAPWARYHSFPANFDIFEWADLSPEEKRLFVGENRGPSWFPEQLNPFTRGDLVHVPTSVGLRYRGELIGWCVTYAFGPTDLTVSSLFVKAEFQPRGYAIRLLAYAIHHAHDCGREDISFNVGIGMTGMLQFFRRHMTPYVTSARTLFRGVTPLQKM